MHSVQKWMLASCTCYECQLVKPSLENNHGYVPLVVNSSGPFPIHDLSPGL
jgi:hypothetical protein